MICAARAKRRHPTTVAEGPVGRLKNTRAELLVCDRWMLCELKGKVINLNINRAMQQHEAMHIHDVEVITVAQ